MTLAADITARVGAFGVSVGLDVAPGGVLALLGPNGAGKSTVLRCLAGLVPIDAGRITIDGTAVDEPLAGRFVRPEERSIGFVFQDYVLFDHLTVVENVAYGLRARRMPKTRAREIARGWIDRLGLTGVALQRPPSLSGGQAQRVALARALATEPRVLLLDEPLAALDASTRAEVRRDLRTHLQSFEGMRVLVTHDPVDAFALADRVAVLDAGKVVQSGTLAEVTAHPRSRYVADLVGVNLIRGRVADGVLTTASGAHVVIADAPAGESFAVIRPHSIALVRDLVPGSVRNTWPGTIGDVDRLGDRVRVVVAGPFPLVAEITAAAMGALELRPGDHIHATVKATDIGVYPA